jgi:nucleotide-binding universal stress UspA family protein
MLTVRTVLHPTDLSEASAGAFRLACSLARDYKARLVVVSAYPRPLTGAEAVDRGRDDTIEQDLLERLRALAPDSPDFRTEHRVGEGEPVDVILGVAEDVGADLIVMGTHGRSGLGRVLLGSVAEQVSRRARCPVATVRPSVSFPQEATGYRVGEGGPVERRTADPSRDVGVGD